MLPYAYKLAINYCSMNRIVFSRLSFFMFPLTVFEQHRIAFQILFYSMLLKNCSWKPHKNYTYASLLSTEYISSVLIVVKIGKRRAMKA